MSKYYQNWEDIGRKSGYKKYNPNYPQNYGSSGNYPKGNRRRKLVKIIIAIIIIITIIVFLSYQLGNISSFIDKQLNAVSGNSSTLTNSSNKVSPSISTGSSISGALVFCINRLVFRTSNSRGLNQSQIQQLITYCAYYDYNPGIINGTDYTSICKGVQECQQDNP